MKRETWTGMRRRWKESSSVRGTASGGIHRKALRRDGYSPEQAAAFRRRYGDGQGRRPAQPYDLSAGSFLPYGVWDSLRKHVHGDRNRILPAAGAKKKHPCQSPLQAPHGCRIFDFLRCDCQDRSYLTDLAPAFSCRRSMVRPHQPFFFGGSVETSLLPFMVLAPTI